MNDFKGQTAIVTGGASGIGEAAALLYAEHGCNVVISDVQEEKGNLLVEKIKQLSGKAIFVKADVSNPQD
ncbi:MAG TPA: SDR family NAD(P)-dependent oxidoreductase, partial [Parafilimonas sp.]|nr:SDR family NAD(P)-dependent oxidoreductase [Parafilimonas sp.]